MLAFTSFLLAVVIISLNFVTNYFENSLIAYIFSASLIAIVVLTIFVKIYYLFASK